MNNIFDWNLIDHKKDKGIAKTTCPACIDTRTNKKDKSLYVRYDSGVAKCFHCEGLSFRDSVSKKTEKNYTLPAQEWRNYTQLSDGLVKWLEGRGIKQFTANELGFTEESFYQPAAGKVVRNLVFNYFESDVLVNKKYRSRDKNFTQSKGAKSIFYNINSIIGSEEAYITEGEIDVASLTQIGKKACISVPNGANNNDDYWLNSEPYLKDIKKFYIATDMDEKGEELAEKISHRLGKYRCERVIFEGKDANEDLQAGLLEITILNTKKYPVSGTITVNDVYNDILALWDNGLPPTIYPKHKCFGDMRQVFSFMMGHLATGTGIPSHGKSELTEWIVMNLVNDYQMKASFFSPEHMPIAQHQARFIQKFHGKNFYKSFPGVPRIDKLDIAKYAEWAQEKIYTTSPENGVVATWDWIFERFKEQMFAYGINIFVIDSWNKVLHTDNKPSLQQIGDILTKLTSFSQQNDVIIILIVHPTKMKKGESGLYAIPDLYDCSGSADFRNQTHDGYCVYRIFENTETGVEGLTQFINLKTKYTFQGKMGECVNFKYHEPSGRLYAEGTEEPTHCLVELNTGVLKQDNDDYTQEYQLPKINASEAFNMDDNIFVNPSLTDDDIPF